MVLYSSSLHSRVGFCWNNSVISDIIKIIGLLYHLFHLYQYYCYYFSLYHWPKSTKMNNRSLFSPPIVHIISYYNTIICYYNTIQRIMAIVWKTQFYGYYLIRLLYQLSSLLYQPLFFTFISITFSQMFLPYVLYQLYTFWFYVHPAGL